MSLNLFKRFGIFPTGDTVDIHKKLATEGHEGFNLYSRHITLADTEALSLPAATEGFCVLFDHTDVGLITVNTDGTVVNTPGSTAGVVKDGTGSIQPSDITADDSAQIKNTSGASMDLRVYYFYR